MHENESDAHLFGIGQYPTTQIVVLTDKTNYARTGSSAAFINIVGPPSTSLLLTIIDHQDNIEFSIFLPAGFGVIPLTWLYFF